jgi:hypothetical protein
VWYDSTGTVTFIDSTLHNPKVSLTLKIASTGSFTVTPEQLARFPAHGQCQIMLTAERTKSGHTANNTYQLRSRCRARTFFMLKP